MKTLTKSSFMLLMAILVNASQSNAAEKTIELRNINIAGIVVDSETLSPVSSASISDSKGKEIGMTDKNGYYNIKIEYTAEGPIKFQFRIDKVGYKSFTQVENWGDLKGGAKSTMYIGIQTKNTASKAFSYLSTHGGDQTYENVLFGFKKIENEQDFAKNLELAKSNNESVFLKVKGKFYIVNKSGWVELTSDKDLISIDNKKIVAADMLNSVIQRKDVKRMTPVRSQTERFAIFTK